MLVALFVVVAVPFFSFAKGDDSCVFKNQKQLEEHLNKHVTYPVTGKALKEVCKKEWPDEFSKEENACADKHIKDNAKFASAADVKKALGVK